MTETLSDLPDLLVGLSDDIEPRKPFLLGARKLSYGAFLDQVMRTRGLFNRLGLEQGDRVALASADEAVVATLYGACLLEGIVAVVIDPAASASEATVLLAKARVAAAFVDRALMDRAKMLSREDGPILVPVGGSGSERTGFGLLIRKKPGPEDTAGLYPATLKTEDRVTGRLDIPADSGALILFTSGTTSTPKGVELTHRNLAAQLRTFQQHYGIDANSRIANHLPLHHTDGLNQGPLLALASGATWIWPPSVTMQNLGAMLDLIYRDRGTFLVTVPTVLAMMMRLPESYDDGFTSPDFRFIISSAGYLDERLWRDVESRFMTMVVNSYGLTETVCETHYCGPSEATRRVGTIGKPVDCEARIVDADGREVGEDELGELQVRGANVMRGYFEDPEATGEVFRGTWLMTGDLATRDSDGFYRIVGRKKNVIIRGGINVYPDDVTAVLLGLGGLAAAVTVGLRDDVLGERVVSCVVPRDLANAPSVDEILAHCRAELAPEKHPNGVLVVEALPYGPSGKIELAKVRAMVEQHEAGGVSLADSKQSPREKVLAIAAAIFQQPMSALSAESSDGTTQGWDSLSSLEFIMTLERQFDFKMDPRDVMNFRSLGDAMRIVEQSVAVRSDRPKELR
jgi:long-chain acyl-CoA synthetase